MTFERYFKASSYCLVGAGFAAIIATGKIDRISGILFAAVFIASLCMDTARLRRCIPGWVLNCITFVYLIFFAVDLRLLSRSFLVATVHLLFFAAAVKLLTLAKDRDYLQLYLISFAEVIAASTLTVNIVFAVCLTVFMFCGISTLILFEMRRSNAKMQDNAKARPFVTRRDLQGSALELFTPFPAGLYSVTAIGITLLIVAVAVPLFFLFPRIAQGIYRQPSGNTRFISGFSDRVELGQIGAIKQSDAVVMRVKTVEPPEDLQHAVKWRGIAFDYFDGRSWKRTDRRRHEIPTQGEYYKLENSAQGTKWLNQTFFIEALPTNVVFAARKVLAVSRDVGSLQQDSAESLYTEQHLFKKLRYSAISDPIRPDPVIISDLLPVPQEILNTYLQLPPEDPRIAELAEQVTKAAPNRFTKAQALERYLRLNYGYSLVLRGTPNSKDPLAMFLFDVRRGHCEYFASSMAIMLRQIGIPTRLVNGFRAGEYNGIGSNWIVRQYDAHSWIEAYFPPYGWIEFDPTPTESEHSRTEFARIISNLADAIDLWWWEGVVNYDSSKQFRAFSGLYAGLEKCQRNMRGFLALVYEKGRIGIAWIHSPSLGADIVKSWILWAPFILISALLLIRPWRRHFFSLARRVLHPGNPGIAAACFYREAVALLGDRGFKPGQGQTPLEFARSLGGHPSHSPFLTLTQMYNSIRFGPPGRTLDHEEAQTQLRLLRDSLRKRQGIKQH
jgi:transglutaminase-like putative cysteine protease